MTTSSQSLHFALEPYRLICNFMAGHSWRTERLPSGDGHPVLVYPGLGVSGTATTELRSRLIQLGYQVYDWELGVGVWPCTSFDSWLHMMATQLQQVHRAHNRKVSLLGWSLGGLYARELAKLYPNEVRQVITLGTPFAGILSQAEMALLAAMPVNSYFDSSLADRFLKAPPVPCASIYSKSDGLIEWTKCVDPDLPDTRNIEVDGVSHFGLVHHPEVLRAVSMFLAEPQTN